MGAAAGGLRFYGKIGLALIAFLIMANQKIDERGCKWVIILILIGAVLSTAQDIFLFYFPIGGATFTRRKSTPRLSILGTNRWPRCPHSDQPVVQPLPIPEYFQHPSPLVAGHVRGLCRADPRQR